nr:Fe(3+)-hydroxamate ABC transporter permease FhuB [Chthonobacter rhizosphaerae]
MSPPRLAALLAFAALAATVVVVWPPLWDGRWDMSASYDVGRMVLLHATLPRLAVALVAGAALGLAGALLQQLLRNPLAEPGTLGVSAGGALAIAAATVSVPTLGGLGRDAVALLGCAAAAALLLGLTARRRFAPLAIVLAGLVLTLWAGSLTAVVVLANERWLSGFFLWGRGSLVQHDWTPALALGLRVLPLAVLAAALARPLGLLDLDDAAARARGVPVTAVRLAGIALAVALTAAVTSAVGVIAFVGLVAPALTRLAGARSIRDRLVWSATIGAVLLWATDMGVQVLTAGTGLFVPTGAVTALFGVPVLLLLLPRLRATAPPPSAAAFGTGTLARGPASAAIAGAAVVGLAAFALLVGRAPNGDWTLALGSDLADLLPWRWPRVAAAFGAGAMLAAAGSLLQRLTGNPMASPEVTGIGAGAGLGLMAALFLLPEPGPATEAAAAAAGAAVALGGVLRLGGRSDHTAERILLVGIGLVALADALSGVIMATGDPRGFRLLRWMGGSTYGATGAAALVALAGGAIALSAVAAARRWLDILPLGRATASSLGVPYGAARIVLFTVAAAASAAATLIVGPLSFAGLIAPHIARELGFARALPQAAAAALIGGALLVAADWIGRMATFPYQLPAGLVATLVGAPVLLLLLNRR